MERERLVLSGCAKWNESTFSSLFALLHCRNSQPFHGRLVGGLWFADLAVMRQEIPLPISPGEERQTFELSSDANVELFFEEVPLWDQRVAVFYPIADFGPLLQLLPDASLAPVTVAAPPWTLPAPLPADLGG